MELPASCLALTEERACLGAALQSAASAEIVVASLTVSDFYDHAASDVFRAMQSCTMSKVPIDRTTVTRWLIEQGHSDHVPATITLDLEDALPTSAHLSHYLRVVKQAAARRRLRDILAQAQERLGDPDADVTETLADLTKDVTDGNPDSDRVYAALPLSRILTEWHTQCDAGPVPRVPTPFSGLNYYLDGGFGPGELIYLGARPRIGKSAFAMQVARTAAGAGFPTLIVSREMYHLVVGRWIVAQATQIPSRTLKTGRLDTTEWNVYRQAYGALASLPLWVTDDTAKLDDVIRMVDRWTGDPLGLVVVDYLQLVQAPRGITERRHQVEAVSSGLKALAMRHRIPVLCLSSLSRPPGGYNDTEPRPTLASLKESGNLEHDADVCLFLHREKPDTDEETELIIAKQKDGPTGALTLRLERTTVSFSEVQTR